MSANYENAGVYELLTKLCEKSAEKFCVQSRISHKEVTSKMRSKSYEILLKRSAESSMESDPIIDLLSHQFVSDQSVRNVAEYKRSIELKKAVHNLQNTDFGDKKELVNNVLKFLVGLRNSSKKDLSVEMFQNPFSFGLLDKMLPKPWQGNFGSPQPYSYFPSYIFELPFSLKRQKSPLNRHNSKCYTEYTVESFDSRSFLPSSESKSTDLKTIPSPMSLPSIVSGCSLYKSSLDFPRLTEPRDLLIPKSEGSDVNVKVSIVSTSESIQEVFKAKSIDYSLDIWELATQVDKDIPDDIWDLAAKLPPIKERQLIASSPREMNLWRKIYGSQLSELSVISEKQFIRHIMFLIIGVETKSFPFCEKLNCFFMKENLVLEGISKEHLKGYVSTLLLVGTYYRRLYTMAFNIELEDHFHNKGLVYEAAREVIRRYLLDFRLKATKIFEEYCKNMSEEVNCMPILLQILYHMEPLMYEISTIASIYKMVDIESTSIPHGTELMSYLFNEISLITHKRTALILFDSLHSICKIYFRFIERFIFEGELDDIFNEFFIRKDKQYVNSRSKRYWDKGFHIRVQMEIPDFLRPLASFILLCGKSLRLLKLCNPSDPLVLLISSDHPSVRCCTSFEELERQQQLLDVYRTRCLFVSGEPVTFEQILLKREAEKKAFTEMASLKQAETMEKIVAERKRLAQLIVAEKQHSLRVLEAAIAEAKAAKHKSRRRERKINTLEEAAEKATEEVDSKIREDEKNKLMEYYSKLNMEVEKSKIHTEWKIKRLQLDQSRMQLLSSEERNLKREKLELEHQRNESVMAMSIQSDFKSEDDLDNIDNNNGEEESNTTDSTPSVENIETDISESNRNKAKAQNSTDVLSAICNVAKSFFGSKPKVVCDNEIEMDSQGNIVSKAKQTPREETSNDVIGAKLDDAFDNLRFLENKQDALKNKQKVMAHEFGQTDSENNDVKNLPMIKTSSIDEENNVEEEWAFVEAKKNKYKVLGTEFDIIQQAKQITEPRTVAQKEALVNKTKVMGVEYNLPLDKKVEKGPANVAQEEAIQNKIKILGSDSYVPTEYVRKEPANVAQEEALQNKIKILGSDSNVPDVYVRKEPANIAQEEALQNKIKILGSDSNVPDVYVRKEPANIAQEEALQNKIKILGSESNVPDEYVRKEPANIAQEEALQNKIKILGSGSNVPDEYVRKEPANIAQEEALQNRIKILGSDPKDPVEYVRKEPANRAQEEAIQNKIKVLGSDYDISTKNSKFVMPKKSALRLNLKPHNGTALHATRVVTPNTGAITPGELFPQLDLETPTTAEMPTDGAITSEVFTPRNEETNMETGITRQDKEFLSSEGFNFSVIDDDTEVSDIIGDLQTVSQDNSPTKSVDFCDMTSKKSIVNIIDGSYDLCSFDPFGVKYLQKYSKNYFCNKISDEMSFYTHPAIIIRESKKQPYDNIFTHKKVTEEKKISCDNIATLTACLQRSVMLPLTYQLEVVDNSILTYFLVNLDMYEHLRSLKDYFFLMDGEFSRSICHNLFAKLTKTLNPQELLNFSTLHNILDKALGSSISHVHKFSENLSFTIAESPVSFQHSSPDVLQCLSLTYSVDWPLNIILSQEALLRYAKVFHFLIKMRRICWILSEDFEVLKLTVKLSRQSRQLLRSPQYISVQIYRHIMASLIRALDNYIVTTCILTSWKEFEMDLKKVRALDDLYDCHVVYIKKVLFRCLLNNRSTPVMKILNDIFTVTLKFSRVLKAGEWQQKESNGTFTHTNFVQIEELFHLFEKLAKYLHKVITKLMECGYQRHLVELLTMINLNGYYDPEKSKEETNTSLQC